jgi:hypothetical protein
MLVVNFLTENFQVSKAQTWSGYWGQFSISTLRANFAPLWVPSRKQGEFSPIGRVFT